MPMNRRSFTLGSAATMAAFATWPQSGSAEVKRSSAIRSDAVALSDGWSLHREGATPQSPIRLPHCVAALSWHAWQAESWQHVWSYSKSFTIPASFQGKRLFLSCERAMSRTKVIFNGHAFPVHEGGFLPFEVDVTEWQRAGDNELILEVDARWIDVPPAGSPKGPSAVDYYLPGGISGCVQLRAIPRIAIRNLIASPVDVLASHPKINIAFDLDADVEQELEIVATLLDGTRVVTRQSLKTAAIPGKAPVEMVLDELTGIVLWDVDNPKLYRVQIAIFHGQQQVDTQSLRIGFRDAQFKLDGFYLNGRKLRLFGLNRHELFPYVGFAASERAMRFDAHSLRHSLNCNIVRCSHYPQSTAFLDACDELGLLVWEEIPGWQYIGDQSWQDIAVHNTEEMIRRDRHHPSIVIWGTRINESANDPALYTRTREAAKRLDPGRQTSGSMTPASRKDWQQHWHEDVFAFDDYHAEPDGSVGIDPALDGVPYMIAEAVGQYAYGTAKNFLRRYRRVGKPEDQRAQALLHAQAHNRAAKDPRNAGVIAWCAFDYASPMNAYNGVKCPGVVDTFRIPKLGAAFYLSQVSPSIRPVIEPSFYWDATSQSGDDKPVIFSNCEQLNLFLDDQFAGSFHPDREGYLHLAYPPFILDLPWTSAASSTLRIEGLIHGKVVMTRSMAGRRNEDRLWLKADDAVLIANGSDSTRVSFGVEDPFGNTRPSAPGSITVQLSGAASLIGDSVFDLRETGAVGAIWVRSLPTSTGNVVVHIRHPYYGEKSLQVRTVRRTTAS
ncbi:beta-galactosidase [Granulicella pectinivorans]|uniref:Beta-galactosidase n=1 Tax=Granulicella pectinivorans TaxID=474950 RepID=A0A1I6MDQ3_9BACT|nr:beta-galactosidase [Granulicella pectinivorans]